MLSKKINSNFAEKFCLVLIIFSISSLSYFFAFKGFKSFFDPKEVLNLKDTVTFGLGVSSLGLALILYSDWREKYVAESLDKDLREIKAFIYDLNFIINRFPSSESETDINARSEFFKIYWKLRLLNSYLKDSHLYKLNAQIESYLLTSHKFINSMVLKEYDTYQEIEVKSKEIFESLNDAIENVRKQNLKST